MRNIKNYNDNELIMIVENEEYFYNEIKANESYTYDYVLALIAEEFIYNPIQLDNLKTYLKNNLTN
jgi:hypothetical protein